MELMGSSMAYGLADQCHTWGFAMVVCLYVTVAGSELMRLLYLVYYIPALGGTIPGMTLNFDGTKI